MDEIKKEETKEKIEKNVELKTNNKKNNLNNDEIIERRTLEQLLKDLRINRNWNYYNLIEELNKQGLKNLTVKQVKKWEVGLEYPNFDIINKLAKVYNEPVARFLMARNNSFEIGKNSIRSAVIKSISYFFGVSIKTAIVLLYIFLFALLIFSFIFFMNSMNGLITRLQFPAI